MSNNPLVAGPCHASVLAIIHTTAFQGREIWDEAAFTRLLDGPGTRALIDPRGGLVVARVAADEAEILTIGVAPDRRRQGIGRGLLRAARDWAAGQGARSLLLEVAANDPAALAFYETAGFAPVGRRPRYYADGGDALVLRLSLCADAAP